LETNHKVIDIAHQSGFAPQPALHNALEPEVEHVMEVEVAQKYADHSLNAKGNFRFERTIVDWRSGFVLDLRRKG
jgi:hypothetical protein